MFKSDGIFSRFMNCLFDILYVGILWIVCSLPVLAAGVYLMPWAVLVIPGVYLYVLSFPMEWILHKLMPDVEEDSEEAKKWYYQKRH